MKIISTSIFGHPHEQNVLLCKLNCEYEIVSEFVLIESAYDFRMKKKGCFLNEVLNQNKFKPFMDKITVLSNYNSFYPENSLYDEQNNLLCEFNSRAYCWEYIKNVYDDQDWILVEDADEMCDFSHPKRRDILLDTFKKENGSIELIQTRYWWDYDNFSLYEKRQPCHQIGKLKEMENPFHHRNRHCKTIHTPIVTAYEYSHCFLKNENWTKVTSASHDRYTEDTMERAYKFNTFHKEPNRSERLNYPIDFFETIDLNKDNSPKFVLDNLDWLRVNIIDPNYAQNRVEEMQIHPHPCLQYNMMAGNKIRKDRNYYGS